MANPHQIYQSRYFSLERHPEPFVCRSEGGHVRIFPLDRGISERRELTTHQAKDLMRLSMVAGQALETVMNRQGVPVVRINYEDLGNWAFKRGERPVLHLHIFGRASNARKQAFPEAVTLPDPQSGFYDDFEALTDEEMGLIGAEVEHLLKLPKYSDEEWGTR